MAEFSTTLRDLPMYRKGNVLSFNLDPNSFDRHLFHSPHLNIKIKGFFGPFTCSPVMEVEVQTKAGPLHAVLKTYDRRYYKTIRDSDSANGTSSAKSDGTEDAVLDQGDIKNAAESTPEADAAWEEYVDQGHAPGLFARLENDELISKEASLALREGSYQHAAIQDWTNEVAAYRTLEHLQGHQIPKFYAKASWRPDRAHGEFFEIGCVLVERIDGLCRLSDIKSHVDDDEQVETARAGLATFKTLMYNHYRIFDPDRHEGNAIVERNTLRLVYIDFAWCMNV